MKKSEYITRGRESYVSPLLQTYPIYVFLILYPIVPREWAWGAGIVATVIIALRFWTAYRQLFKAFLLFAASIISVIGVFTVILIFTGFGKLHNIKAAVAYLTLLLIMYFFKKRVEKILYRNVASLLPMTNLLREMWNYVKIQIIILATFIALYFVFAYTLPDDKYILYSRVLNYVFVGIWGIFLLYGHLRTLFIRASMIDEPYLPIVSKIGEVIGKVHRFNSLNDKKMYTHPIARGILIKDGHLLIQKGATVDQFYGKPKWDNMLSRYVRIGETAKESLEIAALESFGIEIKELLCLTDYIHTTPYEHQHVYVSAILHYHGEIIPNPRKSAQMKWMSVEEIEQELNSGIFNERFVKEFDMIKRAGLIDTDTDLLER